MFRSKCIKLSPLSSLKKAGIVEWFSGTGKWIQLTQEDTHPKESPLKTSSAQSLEVSANLPFNHKSLIAENYWGIVRQFFQWNLWKISEAWNNLKTFIVEPLSHLDAYINSLFRLSAHYYFSLFRVFSLTLKLSSCHNSVLLNNAIIFTSITF